jgi:hypothetical protein
VIRALCDRDFRRPLMGHFKTSAPAPEPKPKAARPPVVAKADAPPALEPKPKVAKPPVVAKADPAPAPLRPALRPALDPPAAPPAPPEALKPKAKPAGPSAPAPAGGGTVAVQVGASPSLPDIQGLLTRFKKKFAGELGGLSAGVATVQVDGKTVNRALVSGFASAAEAKAFCKTLSAAGQACFIRR